jgi:uncharacterized protein YchJ
MTLSRQILRNIDEALLIEFGQETGEWMAKVPISGATKVVWQRYCQAVGGGMGEGVALLILHELASIAGEDAETLAHRLEARETEMKVRAHELKDREKECRERERGLLVREAEVEGREKRVAARERNVAVIEGRFTQQRLHSAGSSSRKLGRNEACWCGSGKKYKYCHGAV